MGMSVGPPIPPDERAHSPARPGPASARPHAVDPAGVEWLTLLAALEALVEEQDEVALPFERPAPPGPDVLDQATDPRRHALGLVSRRRPDAYQESLHASMVHARLRPALNRRETRTPSAGRVRERRRFHPDLRHPPGVEAVAPASLAVPAGPRQCDHQADVRLLVVGVALQQPQLVADG